MVNEQQHIIQKVLVDVQVAKEETAYQLKDNVSTLLKEHILPTVEETLDALSQKRANSKSVLRWDAINLEVNVGTYINPDTLQQALQRQLGKVLEISSESISTNNSVEIISEENSSLEAFLYFLEHGTSPWWMTSQEEMINTGLDEIIQNPSFSKRFKKVLRQKQSQERLVKQFDDHQLGKIFRKENFYLKERIAKHRNTFWKAVFQQFVTNSSELPGKLFEKIKSNDWNMLLDVISNFVGTDTMLSEKEPIEEVSEPIVIEREGYYIRNAGLLLLHPFLAPMFENLNILKKKRIRPKKRAIGTQLLHYLCHKKIATYEHELVLEKILCGIPLNEPIDRFVKLPAKQLEEAENILKSCLEHWEAIKSKSPDALRTAFLQREGKLIVEDTKIRITVERKAQDILLDKLPWGIHLIKLPWLDKLIFVEW